MSRYPLLALVLLATIVPAGAQTSGKPTPRKELFKDLEKMGTEFQRDALDLERTALESDLWRVQHSRKNVATAGASIRMLKEMAEEKTDLTLPPTGAWKRVLVRMKEANKFTQSLESVFGTEISELEALNVVLTASLGEKAPEKPSAVQRQLFEIAKGKTGKDAIRTMVRETERLLSDADERLAKREANLQKNIKAIHEQKEKLKKAPKKK